MGVAGEALFDDAAKGRLEVEEVFTLLDEEGNEKREVRGRLLPSLEALTGEEEAPSSGMEAKSVDAFFSLEVF